MHRANQSLAWLCVVAALAIPARADDPSPTEAAAEATSTRAEAAATEGITALAAFDLLKSMAGTWHGPANIVGGEGLWATHQVELVVNGDVVMETMQPSSGHQMINMYHLDGEELVLAHYCSGGHHPKMRLDRATSTDTRLVFDFVSGSNFDPAVDKHIHDARIEFVDEHTVASTWSAWDGGRKVYEATFDLARSDG